MHPALEDRDVHSRSQALIEGLDARREQLCRALDAAPLSIRARQPARERWSVDEIVEHLSIVEASVAKLLDKRLRGLEEAKLPTVGAEWRGLDPGRVLDRTQLVAATPNVKPRGGTPAVASLAALLRSRALLKVVLRAADGCDVSGITAPHPSLGDLDFLQWVEFVGLHEVRHAAQIDETVAALVKA
jgi:hypothetical protein